MDRRQDDEGLTLENRIALAKAPRRRRSDMKDLAGKVWTSPNTALGLALRGAGYVAGQLNRLRPGDQPDPRVQIGHNAVEFINNPFVRGGITLGNTTNYEGNPYAPDDKVWKGEQPQQHERSHTLQGQQLGPFYLPSNIAGGIFGLVRDRDWHGASNWNEVGPQLTPPRPWPSKESSR